MDIPADWLHDLCGASLPIEMDDMRWLIVCTQTPEHKGPHVGMITWPTLPWHMQDGEK